MTNRLSDAAIKRLPLCGIDADISVKDAIASIILEITERRAADKVLREAMEAGLYTAAMIGSDCAWALADLQKRGVYKPQCRDGRPSKADAQKDYEKILAAAKSMKLALATLKAISHE